MNKINNLTVVIVTYLTDKKILLNCIKAIDKKIKIIIVENSKKFKNKDYFLKNANLICTINFLNHKFLKQRPHDHT